jgi:hypothetical protein
MSRPDPKPAQPGSLGENQAAAWKAWALAAVLAGLVLARSAGGGRAADTDGSGGVEVAYRGRGFELPAERPQLVKVMRAAGPAAGSLASCLCWPGGAKASGPEACLSSSGRYALGLPLDLNRAGLAELERLPGLGRKRAEEILLERARRGGFRSLEECLNLAMVPAAARPALAREFVVEASQASDVDSARKNF